MAESDAQRQRTIGICDGCGKAAVVWLSADGSCRSVSGYNACSCTEASFRAVEGDESSRDRV
ncbi:hypothetical protein [Natrinema caseinilyticum]|uniref:hypothetical protein n=1 Tax=Natrinema caseinilyticum TaxID=2961570 RepID=UPI0020C27864|nr:hypothetical protein [Natrinema caseinilyticum]